MNSPLPFSTPSRKTPGSTPSRSRHSTSRSSSAITRTPGTAPHRGTPGSRYIPNRLDRDVEFSRFQVATPARKIAAKPAGKESNNSNTSPNAADKVEHSRQAMMNQLLALKGQKNTDTVLALSTPHNNHDKYEYWQSYANSNSINSSNKKQRKLPKSADKVLDAPNLINDFYLNVLDWSVSDLLAVALAGSVYIFDVARGDVQQLCDVDEWAGQGVESRYVSSLRWDQSGKHLAVATNNAEIKLWDVSVNKCVRSMKSHGSRVSSMCWHPRSSLLTSGSRSGHIHNYDPRSASQRDVVHSTTRGHKLDVCGLQWCDSGRFLASGGNDNVVHIWDYYSQDPWTKPWRSFTKHRAAVKALAWCPWQPSVLASGGGTADKSIQLVNVCTGDSVGHAHTDSQVSGLVWSSSHRELLSSHGNNANSLRLWKWLPNNNGPVDDGSGKVWLRQLGEVTGHEGRVLHMCTSPDKQTVVTAAADETLRFWKIFGGSSNCMKTRGSPLSDISTYIR